VAGTKRCPSRDARNSPPEHRAAGPGRHDRQAVHEADAREQSRHGEAEVAGAREDRVPQAPERPGDQHRSQRQRAALGFGVEIVECGEEQRQRQRGQRPALELPGSALPLRHVAQAHDPARERAGIPEAFAGDAALAGRRRDQQQEKAARGHQHRREGHRLVDRVIHQYRDHEQRGQQRGTPAQQRQQQPAEPEQGKARLPYQALLDGPAGMGRSRRYCRSNAASKASFR
jgi:hypothetical protein